MKRELTGILAALFLLAGCQHGNRYAFVDIASSEKTLARLTEGFLSIPDSCKQDRKSFLLGEGIPVADILLYGDPCQAIPDGYAADTLSMAVFMDHLHVRHNRLYTDEGSNYRILLLGKDTLSMDELLRLSVLSSEGAFIGGKRPVAVENPSDSVSFFRTVERVWMNGNVMSGRTPGSILKAADVLQDMKTRIQGVSYVHRHLPDAEIYHVRYDGAEPVRAKLKFRVSGRRPTVWNPDTGTISDVTYKIRRKKTKVVLDLVPGDDLFVVFCSYADHHRMRYK